MIRSGSRRAAQQMLGTASAAGGSTLLTDLVSWWDFEETGGVPYADGHGSNNFTSESGVSSTTGLNGNAITIPGASNSYLRQADTASLRGGDRDFTVCGWIYASTWRSSANTTILIKADVGSAEYEYALFYSTTSGAYFRVGDAAGGGTKNVDGATLSTSTWHLLIGWVDTTANTANLQVNNGTALSTDLATLTLATGTYNVDVFFLVAGNGQHDATVDSVAFWSRMLTADERTELYNSGAGLSYSDL